MTMNWNNLIGTLITLGFILGLFVVVYLKITKKTFGEMINDIKELFKEN